tara:strand:+ start:219 stop:470 length:252 start_codon:yes stop_codon:yes gene_type:complete
MKFSKYDYFTKENKGDCFVLYGWGTYPSHSVLAGQSSKGYLKSFDTAPELDQFVIDNALEADWSNQWVEPQVSLNHLPDEGDY